MNLSTSLLAGFLGVASAASVVICQDQNLGGQCAVVDVTGCSKSKSHSEYTCWAFHD